MKKQRKHYTPERKGHHRDAALAGEGSHYIGLWPTVFHPWQKNGAAVFQQKRPTNHSADQERIAYVQQKIEMKNDVLAELMAEHVALKERSGNSDRELGSARYARSDRGVRPAQVAIDCFSHPAT